MEGCSKSKIQEVDLEPDIFNILQQGFIEKIVIQVKDDKMSLNFSESNFKDLKTIVLFKDKLENEEVKAEDKFSLINNKQKKKKKKKKKKAYIILRLTPEVDFNIKYVKRYLITLKNFMTKKVILKNKLIVKHLMHGISQRNDFNIFKYFQKVEIEISWFGFAFIFLELIYIHLSNSEKKIFFTPFHNECRDINFGYGGEF